MNKCVLLMVAVVGVVAGRAPCNNPQWQTFVGQNSVGGTLLTNVTSRAACLSFCAQNSTTCIAVDVDQVGFPPGCWLHFDQDDFLPENVYDQPTTNQYRLTGCSNVSNQLTCGVSTWEAYPNQNSIGASQYVGPRTIQQCLDYCSNNTRCLAVDVDVNEVPLRCWPHFDSSDLIVDNVYPQYGTTQYRLVTRCPVQSPSVCYNPEWTILVNQSSAGAFQAVGPTSVQECLNYCGQSAAGCVAVDVDMKQQPPTCWPHFTTSDLAASRMYQQPSVNQYRLVNKCANSPITVPQSTTTTTAAATTTTTVTTTQAPICPDGRWQSFRDQTAFGAVQFVGPRTIQQCLDYCNSNTSCVAVDINVNEVPIGCWPHFSAADLVSDNIYYQQGTNRYSLVARCTNPAPASVCYNPDWLVLKNTSSVGAVQYFGANSVQECLDYCGRTATGCVAVDVDLSKNPPTCWPHLSSNDLSPTKVYPQTNVNQYRLITKCANYPIGASTTTSTTTTTPPPTTTPGPICPNGRWKLWPNQLSWGAEQYVGPRTVDQCLSYCNNRTDCVAVDVNVNAVPVGCWPHFNVNDLNPDNIYDADGTVLYQLVDRCFNKTVVSDCYNPDWMVLQGQSSVGANQFVGPTTVQQCLDYCGKTASGCVGVDVDTKQQPPACWPHFNLADFNDVIPQDGVNQYRLITKCANYPVGASPPVSSTTTPATTTTLGPTCPHGRWQQFPNQVADGADQYIGPRTIAQCLDYCNNRTDCVAVDVNVNTVPVGCWPHFNEAQLDPSNIYPQQGSVLYKLVDRCTSPTQVVSGCYNPEWTVLVGQSSIGASQYVGPTSVQECLDYCGQTAVGCVAVDVDLSKTPPSCWPHYNSADLDPINVYDQYNVNQYRLVTKCASSPITTTTTTTTTTTPMVKPPVVMSPTYGPLAGGTLVNFTCQTCLMETVARVIFGDSVVNVLTSTQSSIIVSSPQSHMVAMSTVLLVTVEGQRIPIGTPFEYRPNPVVTGIKPLNHLLSGGTLVTISGTNLDSVAHPKLQLTVATFTSPQDVFETPMIERCHKPADQTLIGSQMVCQMPPAVIPADIQSRLELEDGVLSGTRDGGQGGVASVVENDGRTVIVFAGLILDGVTTYNNISSSIKPDVLMDFYVDPAIFCSEGSDGVVFNPKISNIVSITGNNLLRGSRAADYVVSVGDDFICDVISVSDTVLSFVPPTVQPQNASGDDSCLDGGVTLAITSGYAAYRCCIVYSSFSPPPSSSSPNVPLIVGLTIGLIIPFIIGIILIVVCCCCCSRRQTKYNAQKAYVGPIVNPNYEHSTVSTVPSTSSSTAPIEGAAPPSPVQSEAFSFFWAPEKPGGTTRVAPTFTEEKETTSS